MNADNDARRSTDSGASGDPDATRVPDVGALGVVRFLGELALLVALGVTGAHLGGRAWLSWVLTGLLPVLSAVVWGAFIGPRAPRRLTDPTRFGVEIVLFAAASAGLVAAGHPWWAAGLVVVYAVGAVHGRRELPGVGGLRG